MTPEQQAKRKWIQDGLNNAATVDEAARWDRMARLYGFAVKLKKRKRTKKP